MAVTGLVTAPRPADPAAQAGAAIEARGLTKRYRGGVLALDGLSFSAARGTIFALLGPNGAGKSTTVRILTTLSRPDSGSAHVAGIDVLRAPAEVRRVIGYVAQRSGVDPTATGRENLLLQGQLHGLRGRELDRRVEELLERFGLGDVAGRLVQTYSGGMQRRLDIAMALIHRPRVLFLDEPTTGLDPEIRAALWEDIGRLARDEGLTILLTTHYLEEADRLADHVAIIDRGRLVAEGTPHELKSQLRGDAIHLELREAGAGERARAVLERLGGLRDMVVDGPWLRARADDAPRMVPAVLQALEAAGVAVASVTVARPSLDDVYLQHTGRLLRQPGEGEIHR